MLLLAIPGIIISTAMIAVIVVKVFPYNWDWYTGMMFGSIVSTTDPFLSSSLLRTLGKYYIRFYTVFERWARQLWETLVLVHVLLVHVLFTQLDMFIN